MYSHSYRNLASYNTVFNQMFYLSTLTLEFLSKCVCLSTTIFVQITAPKQNHTKSCLQ